MPQMSPYKWTFIFLFLLFTMMLMISFIYFFYFPTLKNYSISCKYPNKWLWKW